MFQTKKKKQFSCEKMSNIKKKNRIVGKKCQRLKNKKQKGPKICIHHEMRVDIYNITINVGDESKVHCKRCDKHEFPPYDDRIWFCFGCERFICDSCKNKTNGFQFLLQTDDSVYICE